MLNKELILSTLIENAQREPGIVSIKSLYGNEYSRPDTIILKGKKRRKVTPDLVIEFNKRTDLYMIEQGTDYDIIKWRLLSLYASQMHGILHIVAPEDYELHISRKIKDSSIDARVVGFS